MAELEKFEQELEEHLNRRERMIAETSIPQLKQCYVQMRSSYEALNNILRKKGLLKTDPYNYEERIAELTVPTDKPYLDSERDKELSIRCAKYLAQLLYLTDYYDWSPEAFTLTRLKMLVQFTRYINWQNLSESATQPTTRGLGEQVAKLKHGSDQLTTNIVADAQEQLSRHSRAALGHLKQITAQRREQYKLEVRREVIPHSGVAANDSDLEAAITKVRALWQKRMPGRPFARELVLEILAENSSVGGDAARQALLDSLRADLDEQKKPQKTGPDLKVLLVEATRAVASCSRPLDSVVRKLNDDAVILQSRKLSLKEMLRAIWQRLRGKDQEGHVYEVEYVDEKTGARQSEPIPFEDFIAAISRRARLYNGILAKSGNAWNRIQAMAEEDLLAFVTKDIQEVQLILRRCESLETMFRAEIDREHRNRLHGINAEIVAMRDHIQRARKKNYEYISKYEELQQLKRLGIDPTT